MSFVHLIILVQSDGHVRDVEKPILVLVFFIDAAHQRGGRWQDFIDKDEDGLLGGQLDAFADDIDKLSNRQVGRNQVFLLIDSCDVRLFDFFADNLVSSRGGLAEGGSIKKGKKKKEREKGQAHGNPIRVFLPDALGFGLALLESVLVLKLADDQRYLSSVKPVDQGGEIRVTCA